MTTRNQELLERLTKFAERLIELCYKFPSNTINKPLINQIIKSSSSMGANYSEACSAESSSDFVHKIKILLKEARETKFFMRLIIKANPTFQTEINKLNIENEELVKIFSVILSKFY